MRWLLLASLWWASIAAAQPEAILASVSFEQRPGARLPLALELRDAAGQPLRLADAFGKTPVILALAWYSCRTVCDTELRELAHSLKAVALQPGADYRLVALSIDPRDGAPAARKIQDSLVEQFGRPQLADGLYVLTASEASIQELAAAIGYRYAYDSATDQYAHPTGIVVLTPDGVIARYLFGLWYPPKTLAQALQDASASRIGGIVNSIITRCYAYDPITGRYTLNILNTMRYLGGAFALLVAAIIAALLWRERRAQKMH